MDFTTLRFVTANMIGLLDKNLTQNLYIGQKKYAYHNFANKLIVELLDRAIQAYHS